MDLFGLHILLYDGETTVRKEEWTGGKINWGKKENIEDYF